MKGINKMYDSDSMLTIIIPIYNAEEYLIECLNSAVKQTLTQIEILLVDDGSTDGSSSICDQYAERDSRIRVIHKANGGVCDARNVGTANVHTKYFTFLESDDWLPLDACEKMLEIAESEAADFVLGAYYKVTSRGKSIKHPYASDKIIFDEISIKQNLMMDILGLTGERLRLPANIDSLLTDTAKLYSTELVKQHELQWISRKVIYSDCLDFILRYAAVCQKAIYIDCPLYYYRRTNTGSQTAGYRESTIELWEKQFELLRTFIEDGCYDNLWEAYYSRMCFSIIPIGGNAYRCGNRKKAMKEIHKALDKSYYEEAFSHFDIAKLPVYFQPLFYFAKHKRYMLFYEMTVIMRKIMNRQRGLL